jgi:hypothetical protein
MNMIIKLVLSVVVISLTAYFLVELWTPKRTVYPLNESVLIPPNITLMLDQDTIYMDGSNTDNPVVVEKGETYRQAINRRMREIKTDYQSPGKNQF